MKENFSQKEQVTGNDLFEENGNWSIRTNLRFSKRIKNHEDDQY